MCSEGICSHGYMLLHAGTDCLKERQLGDTMLEHVYPERLAERKCGRGMKNREELIWIDHIHIPVSLGAGRRT